MNFTKILAKWYEKNKRDLPWRRTKDPYRIWVSEIILQQTRIEQGWDYYLRFIEKFPVLLALASAEEEEVLKLWQGLGYYSRARNMHAAAKEIVNLHHGIFPKTYEEIRKLKGIGDYTAAAISSIAFGIPSPVVDGNVLRLFSRFFGIREPVDTPKGKITVLEKAKELISPEHPGDFNQALMDLGATICKAKNPDCSRCPVASHCKARLHDLQNVLPITRKAPAIPHRKAAAAVIRNSKGMLLVVQRPASGLLASLWKLPGGFIKVDEDTENSLRRSVKEELGISIRPGKHLASVNHIYTHFRITLQAYECRLLKGTPKPLGCPNWRWASLTDLKKLPLSKIDRMIVSQAENECNEV